LNSHLHCSIIGTCLSDAELRRLLERLKISGIDFLRMSTSCTCLACSWQTGRARARKFCKRRWIVATRLRFNRFAKAKDEATVALLWEQSIKVRHSGRLLGGSDASRLNQDKLVQKAFGDIHMLSHLMGATNWPICSA